MTSATLTWGLGIGFKHLFDQIQKEAHLAGLGPLDLWKWDFFKLTKCGPEDNLISLLHPEASIGWRFEVGHSGQFIFFSVIVRETTHGLINQLHVYTGKSIFWCIEEEQLIVALAYYNFVKRLTDVLGADWACGYVDRHHSIEDPMDPQEILLGDFLFRRSGSQILLRHLEESRVLAYDPESDIYENPRIVVMPPTSPEC